MGIFKVNTIRALLAIFCSQALLACASHVRLQSNPSEARVDLIHNQNQGVVQLGTTPLLIDKKTISRHQSSGPFIFRVTRDGFTPREVTIASISGLQIDYNLDLQPLAMSPKTNHLINELFQAQNFAQQRNYDDCIAKLDQLQKEFPEIVAIYEMRGSVYMLRGQYAKANKDFRHALTLDPENKELQAMLQASINRAPPAGYRDVSSEKEAGK